MSTGTEFDRKWAEWTEAYKAANAIKSPIPDNEPNGVRETNLQRDLLGIPVDSFEHLRRKMALPWVAWGALDDDLIMVIQQDFDRVSVAMGLEPIVINRIKGVTH